MDLKQLKQLGPCAWQIPVHGQMRVPVVVYASAALVRAMDDKVFEQAINVARLPGIVGASYVMPDAHWGYGFPIGGVAAFDAAGKVLSIIEPEPSGVASSAFMSLVGALRKCSGTVRDLSCATNALAWL